ncbi:DMT family transporter [Gilvimarinus sp. F26214L]|uniref:DMT family transporter n=1 Tax=Gilvimarinus sp. DZF01 TaxID=3461371 RepID=UPI004045D199
MSPVARRLLPVILVFILGSLWGLHFSLIKIASESDLPPPLITVVTTLGVSLVYILIGLSRGRYPVFAPAPVVFYASCALLGYVLPIFVELFVARHMAAGLLTLIVSTTPVFTLVMALTAKTEPVSPKRMLGVAVGAGAAAMILLPRAFGTASAGFSWVALAFIVPLSYGIFHNYVARAWPEGMDTWQVGAGQMVAALVMMLPLYLLFADPLTPDFSSWRQVHWAIAAMIVFAVAEVYLYFTIIRMAGAVVVSLSNFITIAAGVIWGMLIFNEQPTAWDWICVAILMLSLGLVIEYRKRG